MINTALPSGVTIVIQNSSICVESPKVLGYLKKSLWALKIIPASWFTHGRFQVDLWTNRIYYNKKSHTFSCIKSLYNDQHTLSKGILNHFDGKSQLLHSVFVLILTKKVKKSATPQGTLEWTQSKTWQEYNWYGDITYKELVLLAFQSTNNDKCMGLSVDGFI